MDVFLFVDLLVFVRLLLLVIDGLAEADAVDCPLLFEVPVDDLPDVLDLDVVPRWDFRALPPPSLFFAEVGVGDTGFGGGAIFRLLAQ